MDDVAADRDLPQVCHGFSVSAASAATLLASPNNALHDFSFCGSGNPSPSPGNSLYLKDAAKLPAMPPTTDAPIKISFQGRDEPPPTDTSFAVEDTSGAFGDKGNGLRFGFNCHKGDQSYRLAPFVYTSKAGNGDVHKSSLRLVGNRKCDFDRSDPRSMFADGAEPGDDANWEIEVPQGVYQLTIEHDPDVNPFYLNSVSVWTWEGIRQPVLFAYGPYHYSQPLLKQL